MFPVTVNISKLWTRILLTAGILGTLTGTFTIAGGIKWLQREIHTHQELDSLKAENAILKGTVEDLVKGMEFIFHFGRDMTDDPDKTIYYIDEGRGTNKEIYEVDIRENNEGILFGFVYDKWWIMKLRVDDADSTRMTLLWSNGKDKRIYPSKHYKR